MITRRTLLSSSVAAVAVAQVPDPMQRKSKLKQSVCSSVFGRGTPLETMCWEASRLGFKGFDLRGVQDFPMLKKYGLIPSMVPGGGGTIPEGPIRKENHADIEKKCHEVIDACAAAGAPNAIVLPDRDVAQPMWSPARTAPPDSIMWNCWDQTPVGPDL